MKKHFYIASLVLLSIGITSCEKEEFIDVIGSVETTKESKKGHHINVEISSEDEDDISLDSARALLNTVDLVKEVSDGDDESESGDDSKSGN